MDDRILILWATPRSTSTAFEWMMRMRGDFVCLHEPFGPAYYRGEDRRTTRPEENALDSGRTYATTWQEIQDARKEGRVFSKDFPNYIMHMADGEFLDHIQHTFLIRDPAKSLASMYTHWDEFTMDEASYEDLHRMFDLVVDRYGEISPVVDSDDLLDDPAGTVKAYCEAVGIEFIPKALEWEEGEREEVRWYGGPWHDSLSTSTGLKRQATSYKSTIEDVPFLQEMYHRCKPHYDALVKHKLSPLL
jgi:hypothetical protein